MAEHFCKEHKQVFFKRGKMKGYAHPILDAEGEPTGEWCNEPTLEEDGKPKAGRSYGKSQEELLQTRQLAEAQNRSIQAQTALNRAVEIHIATMAVPVDKTMSLKEIDTLTGHFYQLLQSLTQISVVEVIHRETKSIKETVEKPSAVAGRETIEGTRATDKGGGTPVTNAKELMAWAISHGKEFSPTWVCRQLKVTRTAEITNIAEAYQTIKKDNKWED